MILSEDASGRCWYEAHSVIEDADELYDITLRDQGECDPIRFLRHIGTEEEFFAVERIRRQTAYPFVTPRGYALPRHRERYRGIGAIASGFGIIGLRLHDH